MEKPTVDPRWILVTGAQGTGYRTTANKYWVVAYKLKTGTPWSAKFDLNINTFKSQQGDISGAGGSSSEVGLTGEYADGTEFSFNVLTK